jgi:hypothetical protein
MRVNKQNVCITYKNPVRRLSREVFPAPEGPIMAVSSPDLNVPDTPFKTCFGTATIRREDYRSMNKSS